MPRTAVTPPPAGGAVMSTRFRGACRPVLPVGCDLSGWRVIRRTPPSPT